MADDKHEPPQSAARRKARRRRELDDVFGEPLPDVTGDETPASRGGRRRSDATSDERDDEIRRDVPPHHS
jgi:hypothetical protein